MDELGDYTHGKWIATNHKLSSENDFFIFFL